MEKLNCKGKLVTKQEKKKEIEVMSKQMKPNTQVNKKKGASGITLIALIITIVILIILATITVNFLFGENGLINRAQQGSEEYSKAEAKEKVELLLSEYVIDKATGENDNFANFLRKNLQVGVAENDDNTYSFMLGEWQVVTDENKVISIEKFKLNVDKTYSNVASMKTDTSLTEGKLVQTEGYWDKQYAGGAYYDIVSSTSLTVDEGKCIQLDNGLYAELHPINDTVTVNQFGAYGDGAHDDAEAIQIALNSGYANVSFESERYTFTRASTISINGAFCGISISNDNVALIGNGATLKYNQNAEENKSNVITRQIYLAGTKENPIKNIQIISLNFECSDLREIENDDYEIEITQIYGSFVEDLLISDCKLLVGESVSDIYSTSLTNNLWLQGVGNNIIIENSTFINLTGLEHGGNIWMANGTDDNGNAVLLDSEKVKISNCNFEKTCYDEVIHLFGNNYKNIEISNNTINAHPTQVYEDIGGILFTFGYIDGTERDGSIENLNFHNNIINSTNNVKFIRLSGNDSKDINIFENVIDFNVNRKGEEVNYTPFISNYDNGKIVENVLISDNEIDYSMFGTGNSYLYQFCSNSMIYKDNNITITSDIGSISRMQNTNEFIGNNITINGNIKESLYSGSTFNNNTVTINGTVRIMFYYGSVIEKDLEINNNSFTINDTGNNWDEKSKSFVNFYKATIGNKKIYIENNNINVINNDKIQLLLSLEILDNTPQKVFLRNNTSNVFRRINIVNNSAEHIVVTENGEIYSNQDL